MKIAVTYDNGQVYQHFGMASTVKIYDVQNNSVVSSEVIEMAAAGHSVIAGVLFGSGANVIICGNIRPGAAEALVMSGIQLFAGITGSADEAVASYIAGTLRHHPEACTNDEACGHHHDDEVLH